KFEKLAVVPVEMGGNIDSRVADTLAQILSINLIRSGKYAVYPRTGTLEQVQAEYKTQLSGVTADENIARLGKGENPRLVLSVAARRLGTRTMFNASIINLETGVQMIGASVNYERLEDGIEVMRSLAQELTGVAISDTGTIEEALDTEQEAGTAAGGDGPKRVTGGTTGAQEGAADAKKAQKSGGAFGCGVLNLALGLGSFIQGDAGGGVMTLVSYGAAFGLIGWELTLSYDDGLAGIPGAVGLGVIGFAVVYGFIRPFVYQKNRSLAEFMDGITIAAAPDERRGGTEVRVSWTLRF
ncbi:MAG: hypothetical protein LBB48_01110, partial [Treponema sp.]|nr:hypothetical protein [Treponema sp.]